ncbi:MAG: DUF3592 domain-containing protein [Clostridia bacterium]|nr:DUF3592 domain-containing protein [Clostridia bacterium]MBR6641758.1 DUF3592 domain-containing protein [Clostridia bacterium]
MKMDFRGVPGMGKSIEEKMKEYNEVKDAIQNLSKNKEKNKRETNAQLAMTPWGTVILVALICILVGSLVFYLGINNIKRSIANADDKVYITAEIDYVRSRYSSNGGSELDIEYYINGKRYEDKIETSRDRDQFMKGQPIQVYYYKDNPYNIYLVSEEIGGYILPIVGVIFIIVGFAAIFAKIKAGNIKRKR